MDKQISLSLSLPFLFFSLLSFTVSPRGSIVLSPSNISTQVNATITATCTAKGGPDNRFYWSIHRPGPLGSITQSGQTLEFTVTSIDSTDYCCHVENDAGSDKEYLTVYSKHNREQF